MKKQISAIELTQIASHFPPMSDAELKSMVLRNNITMEKINAFKASLLRGKELVK